MTRNGTLNNLLLKERRDLEAAPSTAGERWLSWALLALILLALAIRVPLLFNAPLYQDETEHLHAAWAVAHGQVPYRDFWQLHPPLLYYLFAPVFALMGEDLRIIYVARGLMLLCILLILLELYRIARMCFDALTGLLAVLLLSYLLLWWGHVYEFRPDIPETLLVLMSLRWFLRAWERDRLSDFIFSGVLLGVGYWVLAKALFPLVGLTLVFVRSIALRRSAAALRHNLTGLCLFLAGFAVPVVFGGLLLGMAGALPSFLRWGVIRTLRYPVRFSAFDQLRPETHYVFFALALVGVVRAVIRLVKGGVVDEVQLSPLLAGSVTAAVFLFVMPAPNAHSALPFLPLAAMYGAEVLRSLIARALPAGVSAPGDTAGPFFTSPSRLAWLGLTGLLLTGACVPPVQALLAGMPPLKDGWADHRQEIRYVLALTSPEDSVFDAHGLYIFRPHATYYYRLGRGVTAWLQSGMIPAADIMEDLRRTHCKVVILSKRTKLLPPELLRFLRSHYVSTAFLAGDEIMVAGSVLHRADLPSMRATVSLIASAEYAVRVRGGTPKVYIDGRLYRMPLFLEQGDHHIVIEGEFQSLAILYSRASAIQFR